MQVSNELIINELSKAQELLWDGSLDKHDEAHNIVANLINDLQQAKNS